MKKIIDRLSIETEIIKHNKNFFKNLQKERFYKTKHVCESSKTIKEKKHVINILGRVHAAHKYAMLNQKMLNVLVMFYNIISKQ